MTSSVLASSDLLHRFAVLVAERLVEELRPMLPGNDIGGATYSTRSLPPDAKSVRSFHIVAKGVPGAWKNGRIWFVPKADWEAARRSRVGRAPSQVSTSEADTDFVERVIAAAGTRATHPTAAR
jgi:hypothetical protein